MNVSLAEKYTFVEVCGADHEMREYVFDRYGADDMDSSTFMINVDYYFDRNDPDYYEQDEEDLNQEYETTLTSLFTEARKLGVDYLLFGDF